MSNRVWSSEQAQQLKSLRNKYSIEQIILARETSISLKQLQQLEEGGCSSFYSEEIKFQVGKRLLSLFEENTNTDADETTNQANKTATQGIDLQLQNIEKLSETKSPTKVSINHESLIHEFWEHYRLPTLIFISLVLALSTRFILDTLNRNNETDLTVKQTTDLQVKHIPEISTIQPSPATPIEQPTQKTITVSEIKAELTNCAFENPELTLMSPGAYKPSNYLYFYANNDANICITDGKNVRQTLTLKKGTSTSVYGSPPWQVGSNQLVDIKIYFQGNHIYVPGTQTRQVLIQENI